MGGARRPEPSPAKRREIRCALCDRLMLAPTSFKTALCCPACLRAAERAKAVAQERAAVRLARERLSKRICERLDAPYAGMSYDDFLGKFEAALIKTTMRTGEPVTYRSGNKRYTFWWHVPGKRLLVKVGWLGGRKSRIHCLAEETDQLERALLEGDDSRLDL